MSARRPTDERDYAALFGVDGSHALTFSARERVARQGTVRETCWLEERDADARLVARYRTWFDRSSCPPYRTRLGWERFSPDGRLLDREVRYSTRAAASALH